MFGFYRFAAVSPTLKVADTNYNCTQIIECAKIAQNENASVVVFPELSITGYTCSDLFFQETLLENSLIALQKIANEFSKSNLIIAVGLPLRIASRLYNCAAFLQHGKLVAVTPKIHLPNQREFYEKRHFSSGRDLLNSNQKYCIEYFGEVCVTNFFTVENSCMRIGVELCEDLWTPAPPSGELALAGANVIVNLSASNALVGKGDYRRNLVLNQSARCMSAYIYASAGVNESTTDMVFSGHLIIAENGSLISENKRFNRNSEVIFADVDIERLNMLRLSEGSFQDYDSSKIFARAVQFKPIIELENLKYRQIFSQPFVPYSVELRDKNCHEIFSIQCAGLAKRIDASHSKRVVLGLSGGLDSTLALLVVVETFKLLNRSTKEILTITMPGFGTTHRTKNNADLLAKFLDVELRTISIADACLQHFKDIGHDKKILDVTYENVQARERTQILMDIANSEKAIVIGTGDLSEIALGFSTYNADHMSMYAVNCDIPKTLVRHIVDWYACNSTGDLHKVLKDILDTPVSPELLPAASDGKILQKTESILGAYEIHDFYLYHFAKYGATPAKMLYLAKYAFAKKYTETELQKALTIFLRRFFTQQFKRSCIPDGPKVGTISLSPRADWRMPSDASFSDWYTIEKTDKI